MKLSSIHESRDISDVSELYSPGNLFLKPMSRINITIHFPTLKQSIPTGGTNVSSWGIMEKLKALVAPDEFISIKTVKNTLEFIRFEGDLESRTVLKSVVGRLDGKKMKVTGIKEPLKILAAEAKIQFPSKYDWDSFFRDARNMNEMKAGERPDTIHFQNLPIDWFRELKSKDSKSNGGGGKDPLEIDPSARPSERMFRRIWEVFGEIRWVDIPMLDPYRNKMKSSLAGIKTFSFNLDRVFEGYVQYKEYLGFVKAMDGLRGSFLAHKEDEKLFVTSIKVDFDKTKHLSEDSILQREAEIKKLKGVSGSIDKPSDTKTPTATASSSKTGEANNGTAKDKDTLDIDTKISMEERKYLVARRKLEAIRLIDFLFERLKAKKIREIQDEKARRRKRKKKQLRKAAEAAAGEAAAKESASAAVAAASTSATPVPTAPTPPVGNTGEMHGKRTKADEEVSLEQMRERLIAARKLGPEEARRKEMAAKSVKRAIQGTRTAGQYANSRRVTLRQFQEHNGYTEHTGVTPIYGSVAADRAYEKYFKSITRR